MAERYGTDLTGLGGFEGGVTSENGAALVSTSSDGETSQIFGPAALRTIQALVENGDFEVVPDDPSSAISGDNPLPYFTFTDNSSGRIVATIADSTIATGQKVLRFTLTGAGASDAVTLTRYVSVPVSEARTYGNQPRWAIAAATSSANYRITISAQYVRSDLTTTTGTSASSSKTGTTMNTDVSTAGRAAEYQLNPNGTGNPPEDAAFLLLTLSVNATGSVASATLDVSEIRIDRSQIQYLVTDQSYPDLYGPAALYLYQGNLFLSNGGVVGSQPKMILGAASGDIIIDASSQGATITLTSATRVASTVTVVTTSAHAFATGYEVVVAGITGAAGTTMNGTYIVTVTNTTTFTYTSAGTAGSGTVGTTPATVKSGPGSGIIYLKPAATKAGKVQVDGIITASNIASGVVSITPVANSTTGVAVTGLAVKTSAVTATQNDVSILVTAISGADALRTSSASAATFSGSNLTGFTVNIFRTNTTATGVWYFAIGR